MNICWHLEIVTRSASFRKSLQLACRETKLSVPRSDRPNLDQPRAFRNRLPRTRAAPHRSSILKFSWWPNSPRRHWRLPQQQKDSWEAYLRTRQFKDWRFDRLRGVRLVYYQFLRFWLNAKLTFISQDGGYTRNRAKQLHADHDYLSCQHYELDAAWSPERD